MLSFILWIFGCIVVIPAMIYIFNKVMKNRACLLYTSDAADER